MQRSDRTTSFQPFSFQYPLSGARWNPWGTGSGGAGPLYMYRMFMSRSLRAFVNGPHSCPLHPAMIRSMETGRGSQIGDTRQFRALLTCG
jgi:hypothetical protein